MKNIIHIKEASVAPAAVIVIFLVIIAGIGYFMYSGSGSEYWETKNEFGTWKEEILIEYEDGSQQSLKLLQDNVNNPFASVKYNGQDVTNVYYNVYANAQGSGYDSIEIEGYRTQWKYYMGSTLKYGPMQKSHGTISFGFGSNVKLSEGKAQAYNDLKNRDPGTYTLKFVLLSEYGSNARYRGIPGGSWEYVSLPPDRNVNLVVEEDRTLSISLSSGIDT